MDLLSQTARGRYRAVGRQTAGVLAAELERYVQSHHVHRSIHVHALRPGDVAVQNDLANVALARGDTTTAFHRFETLLRQDSTVAGAWLNLGILYAVTGRREAARSAWERTLRYQPDDAQARAYLAQLEE